MTIELNKSNNPFPEYGDIQKITLQCYAIPLSIDYDLVFYLEIKYEKYTCNYESKSLKNEDWAEVRNNILNNATFKVKNECIMPSLIWDNFEFKPVSIECEIYTNE
jgi:hypothetical protein